MKNVSKLLMLCFLSFGIFSCSDDDDNPSTVNPETLDLVEAAEAGGLTDLLTAVGQVEGLDQTLLNAEQITVFAPSNQAFDAALVDYGVDTLPELIESIGGVGNLETLLEFHVVPAVAFSSDLQEGSQSFPTLAEEEITVTLENGVVTVEDSFGNLATVTQADVEIENGVVHIIDEVLIPVLPVAPLPDLVEAAQAAELNSLLDAVGAVEGLDQELLDAQNITVFAPTDEAFGELLNELGVETLDELIEEIGLENLRTVLEFHVIPAVAFAEDLPEGSNTFTTLADQEITVTRTGDAVSVTDANGDTYDVTTPNVAIENGVVHVIDGVLLPELEPLNTFSIIAASENHTILEQLLVDAGLDDVLSSGVFTVFAPTDDAFDGVDTSGLTAEQVTNILLNHVVTGNILSTDLTNGYVKTNATETYSGNDNFIDMYVNTDGGVTLNDGASVTAANLESANGTVHVVDQVIMIPDVVGLAAANPMFSSLATALTQEELLGVLSTAPDTSPAPFTVFAPDNDAFDNFLAEDNGFDTIQDVLDTPILTDVLTYHVIPEAAVRAGDITDGINPATVQSETITINTTNGVTITDQNGRVVNVIATDVTGSNGVIHVIDNVILPTL